MGTTVPSCRNGAKFILSISRLSPSRTKTLMVCFKSSFPSFDVTYVVLPLPEEHHPPAFLTRFGISRSICSEEESCPYILHVLEKALQMTIRRVLPLASACSQQHSYNIQSLITLLGLHSYSAYQFCLQPPGAPAFI
ncbi:hypothetical protein IGI04_040140 [Brassica rapa subsp. trilocularis]|uniref:Uncharacterized protein n=1 Tax=Brassica rapa subsp. trilocularis TaxID=1813537 RepID=A0ABQ7KMU1_BRACM|nr:hypothetical protein IGI04_040140 [Brassica rapa subsp. trilocularis]